MLIGLTYDLRDDYRGMGYPEEALAEFDSPETIQAVEETLNALGYETVRIGHIRHLAERLVAGGRWDLVFNIAEGLTGRSREAQVPALLEAYNIPYVFSDPLTCAATLDKGVAKSLVRDVGIPTAPFTVLSEPADLAAFNMIYPVFVKPLAEGTGKGCERASKVSNARELKAAAQSIWRRFNQPAIAEPYLPGREFTVGITGNGRSAEIIAVMEINLLPTADAGVYSLLNKEECESRVHYALAGDAEAIAAGQVALRSYRALGCRDAARVDIRSDGNANPMFLEVNPLAGIHPAHSDLPILSTLAGISYSALIARIMDAAKSRYGLTGKVEPALCSL